MRRSAGTVFAAAAAMVLVACSDGRAAPAPITTRSVTAHPSSGRVPAAAGERSTTQHPPFAWHTSPVTASQLGKSWHSGCPVGPSQLRAVHMTFWGFDRTAHQGTLVVRSTVVHAIVTAFQRMYHDRFPFRRMHPIARYGGSDNRSMRHDNTSAFNCRYAVADGPKTWSMHAYGEAVDIDPVENPYTLDGKTYPPQGAPYTDRSDRRRGMVTPGSTPVKAFAAVGWGWGGNWSSSPDYQHFSSNGR